MPTPPRNPRRNRPASPFRLPDSHIYILALDGVAGAIDERLLLEKANEFSRALGHLAYYQLFTHGTRASLDAKYLDRGDNYAIIGQDASQTRSYWRDRQSRKANLARSAGNERDWRSPGGPPRQPPRRLSTSVGKLAGLSVQIARNRWRTLQSMAQARHRLKIDEHLRFVPQVEELLALAMIQQIGRDHAGHRSNRPAGAEEFLRERLLTTDGFEAALASPATIKLLETLHEMMLAKDLAADGSRHVIHLYEREEE